MLNLLRIGGALIAKALVSLIFKARHLFLICSYVSEQRLAIKFQKVSSLPASVLGKHQGWVIFTHYLWSGFWHNISLGLCGPEKLLKGVVLRPRGPVGIPFRKDFITVHFALPKLQPGIPNGFRNPLKASCMPRGQPYCGSPTPSLIENEKRPRLIHCIPASLCVGPGVRHLPRIIQRSL